MNMKRTENRKWQYNFDFDTNASTLNSCRILGHEKRPCRTEVNPKVWTKNY